MHTLRNFRLLVKLGNKHILHLFIGEKSDYERAYQYDHCAEPTNVTDHVKL